MEWYKVYQIEYPKNVTKISHKIERSLNCINRYFILKVIIFTGSNLLKLLQISVLLLFSHIIAIWYSLLLFLIHKSLLRISMVIIPFPCPPYLRLIYVGRGKSLLPKGAQESNFRSVFNTKKQYNKKYIATMPNWQDYLQYVFIFQGKSTF